MAYIDQRTGRNQRAAVIAVVATLQGAAILALINGLAVHWRDQAPRERTEAEQIKLDPIPIPPPPKKPIEQNTRIDNPKPQMPPISDASPYDPPPIPAQPEAVPTPTYDPPPPQPPVAQPRAPKPRNAPGGWATPNDYPARDLREGNQGVTQFTLEVGADGRVQSCRVTMSSGFPGLDKATCDNVSRRARFEPATDGGGNRITGTYSNRIRWEIPQG